MLYLNVREKSWQSDLVRHVFPFLHVMFDINPIKSCFNLKQMSILKVQMSFSGIGRLFSITGHHPSLQTKIRSREMDTLLFNGPMNLFKEHD